MADMTTALLWTMVAGVFNWPYQSGPDDPQNEAENAAYKEGFDQRRKELGDAFKWC